MCQVSPGRAMPASADSQPPIRHGKRRNRMLQACLSAIHLYLRGGRVGRRQQVLGTEAACLCHSERSSSKLPPAAHACPLLQAAVGALRHAAARCMHGEPSCRLQCSRAVDSVVLLRNCNTTIASCNASSVAALKAAPSAPPAWSNSSAAVLYGALAQQCRKSKAHHCDGCFWRTNHSSLVYAVIC